MAQPSLAIADNRRFAVSLGVERDYPLEKSSLGLGDVLDCLARHWLGKEADEVAGMTGLESNADLTLRLETADTRTMAGARIDDDERPLVLVDFDAGRRRYTDQNVVHGTRQSAAVHDDFATELEDVRSELGNLFLTLDAALVEDVEKEHAALECIDRV